MIRLYPFHRYLSQQGLAAFVPFLLLAFFLTILTVGGTVRAEGPIELSLYSLENERLVYRGKRTHKTGGGRIIVRTVFTTPAGKPIQETEGVYMVEGLEPVYFTLEDLRSGEKEELRKKGNTIHMSYRENREEDLESDTEDWERGSLFTATVEPFILKSWETLMKGEELEFPYLVPSRQDIFSFRILMDDERSASEKERIVIRMEPDSWFVRRLVDPLFFYFSKDTPRRLLEYHGRISIKTEDGDTQDLRMTYSYLGEG